MYIAISPQKMGSTYTGSVRNYVDYLEKENLDRNVLEKEHFFNQHSDKIAPETVINEIDTNTAKLRNKDPKFYSIVVSPSQRELRTIAHNPEKLKEYTRQLMNDYAKSFHRNQEVTSKDIKYFAKIEHQRTYSGFDRKVVQNVPYRKEIVKLQNDIRKIERGEIAGKVHTLENKIKKLIDQAPHKQNGKLIKAGMQKEGNQTHVHIIVSRKDQSNTYTLSPMAKHKASEVVLNGKTAKRGFDRDTFFEAAEKIFDKVTGHQRNYVETYAAKKAFIKNPAAFFTKLVGLPTKEKDLAFKLLRSSGINIPKIAKNQYQLAVKVIQKLNKGIGKVTKSAEIDMGY